MKFELKNAYKFGWKGLKGWAFNNKENFPNASAAYFEVTGRHGKVKTSKSDRIYFIIDGEGEFNINGESFKVVKTDVIIVPKNTPYDYKAISDVLKLFLVHSPAFDPEADVKLE
jgi:mannose-6-phosphate isomerase-like protein (cupin superfamily)